MDDHDARGGDDGADAAPESSRDAELVTVYEVEVLASDPTKAAHAIAALRRRVKRLIDLVASDHVRLDLLYRERRDRADAGGVDGEAPRAAPPAE